jgi:hypothetical protein
VSVPGVTTTNLSAAIGGAGGVSQFPLRRAPIIRTGSPAGTTVLSVASGTSATARARTRPPVPGQGLDHVPLTAQAARALGTALLNAADPCG